MSNAQLAMGRQPSVVDARSQTQFILDRTDSVAEMGYIKKKPGRDAIDWTLLEQVIAENPDRHTLEVRILPGSIDGTSVIRQAALVEGLLQRCLDPSPLVSW